jgi:hypothetical protein
MPDATIVIIVAVMGFGVGFWFGSSVILGNLRNGKYPSKQLGHWKELAEWNEKRPAIPEELR